MIILKRFTIVAALLAGGTSLAMAQNGLPTGGEPPVAGGAAGNPIPGSENTPAVPGAAPAYFAAPGYQPGKWNRRSTACASCESQNVHV
jgi:hypothetical protein